MHANKLCHKVLPKALDWMHAARRESLSAAVLAAISGQRATVTGLGRALDSDAKEKNCIKRLDRLLSNSLLHGERRDVYTCITRIIVGCVQRPIILLDWSDIDESKTHFLLRAAIPTEGRSLTLYEETHPMETYGKAKAHQVFLHRLKTMLPSDCRPIIVADAGFRTPWYKQVEKLGWDWVARVRNSNMVELPDGTGWVPCKSLYPLATSTPQQVSSIRITKKGPHTCNLVLYKKKPKGRVNKNKSGQRARAKVSIQNADREREPWLLATSLPVNSTLAKRVVKLYASRMQIEEGFRDTKSTRFGLGFELNLSYVTERIQILLLIVMLATFIIWLLGNIAVQTNQHRQYQANSIKSRNVLSTHYLGLRVAFDRRFNMTAEDIHNVAKYLVTLVASQGEFW